MAWTKFNNASSEWGESIASVVMNTSTANNTNDTNDDLAVVVLCNDDLETALTIVVYLITKVTDDIHAPMVDVDKTMPKVADKKTTMTSDVVILSVTNNVPYDSPKI